jgi:aldose 1-epimerase
MHTARRDGGIVHLEDSVSQTAIAIATHVGNFVFRMTVNGHDVLYFPFSSIDEYAAHPRGWYGVPLLAPWANRLDETAFYANGRRFGFDMDLGNVTPEVPLHGFLSFAAEWEVTGIGGGDRAAWVTSRLDVYRRPEWIKQWPFAHTIEMTHRLEEGVLEIATTLTNHSIDPMPVAIGFHPYFQLTDSPRSEWTIAVPARARWLLSNRLLPTGQTEPTGHFFPGREGRLQDYNLDDVFDDLVTDGEGHAVVSVKGREQQIDVVFGPKYRALVIYAPHPANTGRGSRIVFPDESAAPTALTRYDFICLEPMAAITNALNLAEHGGYRELQSIEPGGRWTESFWIRPSGFVPAAWRAARPGADQPEALK